MDIAIVFVLLLVGITLFLVEIFLLPGVTFAAIGGALFCVGGIVYAYLQLGTVGGIIAFLGAAIIFIIVFYWLVKSKALDQISLKTEIKSTVADRNNLLTQINIGDIGVTISRLNPIGRAKIGQIVVEAKTLGGFVDEGVDIVVLKVDPTQVLVEVKHKNINK